MLSFDEDGLDETAPYGPQHSTPVKNKFGKFNSSVSSNPKSKMTISQGKSSERKEFQDSFTSPSNPADLSTCKRVDLSSRRQCAHMAQHFIPDDGADISQIPPSEGSHMHRPRAADQCDECSYPSQNRLPCGKNGSQIFRKASDHETHSESSMKCKSCAKSTTVESPECRTQYTLQSNCQCRLPSSYSNHQSRTSSPSRRSDNRCCHHSSSRQNGQGLFHRTSEASLSAHTSECCSPKQTKSSVFSINSLVRNVVSSRSGCRSSSSTCRPGCSGQKYRSHSLPRTGYSGVNLCNHSTELDGSVLSMADITKQAPAIFLDNDIISKQREEIQLLMDELAERDQELNDLVTSHQKQVRVWEADRDKLDSLQARLTKYEGELSSKEQQLKETLEEMGRVQEQKELDLTELGKTQADMLKLAERISENSNYIHEIEIQNKSLGTKVKELLADKIRLEEREQELMLQVDAKNSETIELQAGMKKMTEKIECLENQVEITEEKCRRKIQENEAWRAKFFMEKDEAEKLAADCDSKDLSMAKMTQQLQESLQQAVALQKALFTSCEREKCKEEVLHSLRKQHKRTMQELSNIRELYDLQNRDLTSNHHSGKESATARDKSARSPVSGRDNFMDRLSSIKETRMAGRKRRETHGDGEASKSVSNELSESRTDAQFDGDDLNTCQSRLTNVLVSPRSELQECNPDQQPLHFSYGDSQATGQLHLKMSGAAKAGNATIHTRTKETPLKSSNARLESRIDAPARSQSQPQSISHSQAHGQGQSQEQPVQHTKSQPHHQPQSHKPHAAPQSQPQPASDLSHYSTASAASVKGNKSKAQRGPANPKPDDRQEKPQQLSHDQRAERCQSSEPPVPQDTRVQRSESDRKTRQKDHHPCHQYETEEPCTAKGGSPRRALNAEERKNRDRSGGSSPEKRSLTQTKVSPSCSPSKGRRAESHAETFELDVRNKYGHSELGTKGGNYSLHAAQTQHKQKDHGEKQKSSKHPENHNVVKTEESLGSLISKHADSSTSPVQRLVNKLTGKQTGAPDPSESPKKIYRLKGSESRQQAEGCEGDSGVAENRKRKATIIRQDSYVITADQARQVDEVKTLVGEAQASKSKLSRHSRREERQSDHSPDKSNHRGHGADQTPTLAKEETRKDEWNGGRSTPRFCPSMSDVSNFPSPCKFDDELTPADSDGMCRELKRDLKKLRRSRSPGAKVSYRKCSAWKKDNEIKGESVTSDDKDKTPVVSVADTGHEELDSSGELKKSCSSQGTRTPKGNVSMDEMKVRKNSSLYNTSSIDKSPDWSKRCAETTHHKEDAAQIEQDRKYLDSSRDGAEKTSQYEKISRNKKSKSHSSAALDEELSGKERVAEMSSRHSGRTTSEVLLGRYENDEVLKVKQVKYCLREKDQSKDKSLGILDLPLERHKYREDTHHGNDYRADRRLQPQFEAFDDHPCISPRPFETSKRFGMADTPISSSNKSSSYYYKPGQYGSPDLPREPVYTSRPLHSTVTSKHSSGLSLGAPSKHSSGLSLGASLARSSGLVLSPSKSIGTSYTKSDPASRHVPSSGMGTQCSSGSGIASTTTTTYSNRRFLPSGVGTYLSHRFTSWYHGNSSVSYALNNNNENDSHGNGKDGADDDDDDNDGGGYDGTDDSRCSDGKYADGPHLNTNNNEGCEVAGSSPAGKEVDDSINNDVATDNSNSNNNNVNPININDISLEEFVWDVPPRNHHLVGDENVATHSAERTESCSDVDVSVSALLIAEQSLQPTGDALENQFISPPASQGTELVPSKPFTTRGQPSLYRQLAQIHFSEKTRRYEWVVVPPHLADGRQSVEPQHGSSSEQVPNQCVTSEQVSESHLNSESKTMLVSRGDRMDSKSSEDSCCNSVSTSSLDARMSCMNEVSSRTGITTSNSHSDSGLCSLSSYEGFHTCSYNRQKSQPPNSHIHSVTSYGLSESVVSSETTQTNCSAGMMHGLKQQCHNIGNELNKNSLKDSINCAFAMSKTLTASTSSSSVASNMKAVTTVTSSCHSNGTVSTSLLDTMVESFMGVAPSQQETPQRTSRPGHSEENQVDSPAHGKNPHLSIHSSRLDQVVKKLDFDDTTLDVSAMDTLDKQEVTMTGVGHLVKRLEFDAIKLENDNTSWQGSPNGSIMEALPMKGKKSASIVKAADHLPPSMDIVSRRMRKEMQADTGDDKDVKEYMPSSWIKRDDTCTTNQEVHKRSCDSADICSQASLSEYFQDISTLSVEPDSNMSHVEDGGIPGYKHVAAFNTHVEKPQCASDSNEELKQTDIEMKSQSIEIYNQQLHCAFNPQTKRYVTLRRLDNGIYEEVPFHGDVDAVCTKNVDDGHFPSPEESKAGKHKHPDSEVGVKGKMECTSQQKESSRQQGVWIYEDSVEEVAEHFDDKLSLFLEEKDLVETTQKILQGSPPPMSPATKLHRLLLESQHLIWALERSSAVPEALRSGLTHY